MQMAEGLDTGDMLLTYETKVGEKETAGELLTVWRSPVRNF